MHISRRRFLQAGVAWGRRAHAALVRPAAGRESCSGRQTHEVRSTGAAPRSRDRRRDAERTEPVLVHPDRDLAAAAPRPAADAAVGVRRRLRARGAGGLVRDGGRGAERHAAHGELHARPARDLPGLDPGRHPADAARQRGPADDPPARRVRRGRQRRQPRGDARTGSVRARRRASSTPTSCPRCRRRCSWFHDHGLGTTRLNVFAGLAAAYILRDEFDTGARAQPDRDPRRRLRDPAGRSRTASSTPTGRSCTRRATSRARHGSASTSATRCSSTARSGRSSTSSPGCTGSGS